jgi:hypothetical protein
MELVSKGESRCYVFREEDIQKVCDMVKEINEFEYGYMPNNWVTVFNSKDVHKNYMVYNGKFDIDVPKLIDECGKRGVGIIVRSTNIQDDCW